MIFCRLFWHRWTTVIEWAIFSKDEVFYECSRCKLKEEARILADGSIIVRKRSREIIIRPKENDSPKKEVAS